MSTPKPHSTVATRMSGIREDWLRLTQEEVLEPDLAIVDPHHHLWDFPTHRYLLPDLLADTDSGHKIESTVFIECTACYRTDGPPELRTLGETEFVNGIAAMSASDAYGPTRVAAGIVGLVDLTIGDRAEEVLRAHMAAAGPRFKGIRHAAGWEDKVPEIHNSHTNPPLIPPHSPGRRPRFVPTARMANTKTVLHPWPELVGPFPHGGNLNRALVVRGTEPSTVHPEDEKHEPRNVARFHLQSGLWVPNLGLPGSRRTTMMKLICGSISALALASALSITAHAQTSDAGIEFAFMPRTMTVTLLNEGGKYVAIDLKHIAQGGTCRMDKDATIARVGEGDRGMVRVRYAAAQISSGGCPFMTTFDIPAAEYAQGRAEFVAKKDEAWKKVDEIKNDLGTKWEELTGKKG